MMDSIFIIVKKHRLLISVLGLAYAAELIFPAFGPVLNLTVGGKQALYMSSWSMLFLILGFIIKPWKRVEVNKFFLPFLVFILGFITCFFSYLPVYAQWILLAAFGYTIGRIGIFWSRLFLSEIPFESRGKVISLSLFLCYGLLYIGNVIIPSVPKEIAPMIPGLLLWLSMTFYIKHGNSEVIELQTEKKPQKVLPWSFFGLVFIIYITAGITYAGLYPELNYYSQFERYYNVLPFVLVILIAGYIADRYGRKYLLFIGIAFLGFSFAFYTLPQSIITYFLTQNTLQPGWAFMDAYVWIAAADLAVENNQPNVQAFSVASFLSGTAFGSFIAFMLDDSGFSSSPYFGIITYIPLFAAIALLLIIPEIVEKRKIIWQHVEDDYVILHPIMANKLTSREKEVAEYLIRNKSGEEICERLSISNNTLKTHKRNIYRKLEISSKKELQKKQKQLI